VPITRKKALKYPFFVFGNGSTKIEISKIKGKKIILKVTSRKSFILLGFISFFNSNAPQGDVGFELKG
jgi:hypothetical protein